MAVFEQFPYTNMHELNLDWIVKTVLSMQERLDSFDLDAVKEELANYIDAELLARLSDDHLEALILQVIAAGVPHDHATFHNDIYVNGQTGNDNNDGTVTAPLKTMDAAFDKMARTGASAYIFITGSGSYYINKPVISACMLHIMVQASNVTLYWMPTATSGWLKAFYDCYVHLDGYSDGTTVFYMHGTQGGKLEGGAFFAQNVTFDGDSNLTWGILTAGAIFQACTFNMTVQVSAAKVAFSNCVFNETNRSNIGPCIQAYNASTVEILGGSTFNYITDALTSSLINISASSLYLLNTPSVNFTDAVTYVVASSVDIHGTPARCVAWLEGHSNLTSVTVNQFFYETTPAVVCKRRNKLADPAAYNTYYQANGCCNKYGIAARLKSGNTVLAENYIEMEKPDAVTSFMIPLFSYNGAYTSNSNVAFEAVVRITGTRQVRVNLVNRYLADGTKQSAADPDVEFTFYELYL